MGAYRLASPRYHRPIGAPAREMDGYWVATSGVREKVIGQDIAARAQLADGAEMDGVPEDDGGGGEVEAGRAVTLVFEGAVGISPRRWKNTARLRA